MTSSSSADIVYSSVFRTYLSSGTLCSNFDCLRNPCRFGGELLRPKRPKFEAEGRERRRGSWGGGSEPLPTSYGGLGEHCKLPQWGSGQNPNHKHILDPLRAYKTCLVAAKVVNFLLSTGGPAAPLDTTSGTLWFCSAEPRLKNTGVQFACMSC